LYSLIENRGVNGDGGLWDTEMIAVMRTKNDIGAGEVEEYVQTRFVCGGCDSGHVIV
jgi:hypothetical protein